MPLCLKVRWSPSNFSYMNFDPNLTVEATILEIITKFNVKPNKNHWLFSPPNGTRSWFWLEPDTKLSDYDLVDRDSIELKFQPKELYICLSDGSLPESFNFSPGNKIVLGTLLVDYDDPFRDYFAAIYSLLKQTKELYCFLQMIDDLGKIRFHWVNSNISLAEQDIRFGSFILLYPVSQLTSRRIGDYLDVVIKEGYLTKKSIKAHKTTNSKKRWCVIRNHFLYYFASSSEKQANGVVPLEFYDFIQETKNGKLEFVLRAVKENLPALVSASTFVFECDEEKDFREWSNFVIQRCVVGAGSKVFGVNLIKAMRRKSAEGKLPAIVTKTVEFIEEHGLDLQGIFRISGSSISITKFREEFDRGFNVAFDPSTDPHIVTGLLKLYVRELPEPLLPFNLYSDFITVGSENDAQQMDKLAQLITKLPLEHKRVLVYLLHFLKRVSTHAEVSLMTVQNLALVFGPNILRPRDGSPESAGIVAATPIICRITELMINQTDRLFGNTTEVEPARTRARPAVVPAIELPKDIKETKENAFSSGFVPGKSPRRVQSIRIGQTPVGSREVADDTSSALRRSSKSSSTLGGSINDEKGPIKRAVSVKFDKSVLDSTPVVTLGAERGKVRVELSIESLLDRLAEEISAREELERRIAVLENLLQSS